MDPKIDTLGNDAEESPARSCDNIPLVMDTLTKLRMNLLRNGSYIDPDVIATMDRNIGDSLQNVEKSLDAGHAKLEMMMNTLNEIRYRLLESQLKMLLVIHDHDDINEQTKKKVHFAPLVAEKKEQIVDDVGLEEADQVEQTEDEAAKDKKEPCDDAVAMSEESSVSEDTDDSD